MKNPCVTCFKVFCFSKFYLIQAVYVTKKFEGFIKFKKFEGFEKFEMFRMFKMFESFLIIEPGERKC